MTAIDFERTREAILAHLKGAEVHGAEHQAGGVMVGICDDAIRERYTIALEDDDAFSRGFLAPPRVKRECR